MNNPIGLLYPAFQKFYNALTSLENFEKGKSFFDNISYLDTFFSEYRNVTFVIQKALAHTVFMSDYEKIRNEFLVNDVGKWFINKRNEVLKEHPFELEKRIDITVYSSEATTSISTLVFTIENDEDYSTIINALREQLLSFGKLEVMFSVEFSFFEKGKHEDLYDKLIFGIGQMKSFLKALRAAVNEDCSLSATLEDKIQKLNFYRVPKNMLFVDDYIFLHRTNSFEKASRMEFRPAGQQARYPLKNFDTIAGNDLFDKFEVMHLVAFQKQRTILPTCLVLYCDDTFELLTFGFSLKTTLYRKLHEVAKRIASDGIVKVFFVNEMYSYENMDVLKLESSQRIEFASKELLMFCSVDKELNIKTRSYDTERINDFEYIASVMMEIDTMSIQPAFMNSIIQEFSRIYKS